MEIQNNDALTSLTGLSALTSVDGYLYIGHNASLMNLDGLDTLTYVGYLGISDNASLTSLAGLNALTSVGRLGVSGNASLTNLDALSGLTSLGSLEILVNDRLSNIDGLSGISSAVEWLLIVGNASLTNLDALSGITAVEKDLSINFNAALTSLGGLSGISSSVGGDLSIVGNATLTSIGGLARIDSVAGELRIEDNASLTNLDGLAALTSVGENAPCRWGVGCWLIPPPQIKADLIIKTNAALTNLDGLTALTAVGRDLSVEGNYVLTACSQGLDALIGEGGVGGSITMQGNAPSGDCNNNGEDLTLTVDIEQGHESGLPTAFALFQNYPNPFNPAASSGGSPTTTIAYALPRSAEARLTVVDMRGSVVRERAFGTQPAGTYEVRFDATGLPSGVYFYRLQAGDFVETRRMVVAR